MKLTPKQQRHLKTLAHNRKPIVIVGSAGLTDNVIAEISNALDHHELIKIRVNAADKQSRTKMIETICQQTQSTLVFAIGHVATVYRRADKPTIVLP